MDGPLKELAKLEKLTSASPGKGKATISDSLDSLLQSLRDARAAIQPGPVSPDLLLQLSQAVDIKKKEVDDRQKEIYNSVSRLGKALDKKFTAALPSYPEVFTSHTSVTALERTIALHFLRTGQFDTAGIFLQEAGLDIPAELRAQFIDLHRILQALRNQDIGPALGWVAKNRGFLRERASPLEFHLHRSQYIRLLLSTHPPNVMAALAYAKEHMGSFYEENEDECRRLTGCILYLPLSKLQTSPYADLASPSIAFRLGAAFCQGILCQSRHEPARDIGGGGALSRIEKGRKVMRERKSEWSQADELPIEIPLPPENRYHSIFACPVSKEQSTETNPPMMMGCGHVVTKDNVAKTDVFVRHGRRVLTRAPHALHAVPDLFMSGFKPTRTSPPSKLTGLTESFLNSTLSTDLSRSSSVSIKELIGLTHGEVELLDAIIARAGASATTFPAVFSAYNAVLKERGLDPSEVVFYGKLLKLGTLKGTNWGEKWRMVKVQQGYGNTARSSHLLPGATPKPMKSAPTRPTRLDLPSTVPRHTGSSTLHSRENESTNVDFDDEESISVNVPQYHLLKRPAAMRSASPVYSEITSATLDSRKHPPLAPNSRSRPMPPLRRQMWETDPSDASEHHGAPSTTPPSYRAAVREPEPARRRIITPTSPSPTKRPSSSSLAAARQLVAQAKERKGSVLNEDDAWKKVAMLQDEKNADAFRQDRLVERYWEMWREGFQLIISMENRAAAHAVIRDLRFLRAVYMVMKFRYQERRRRLKDAWAVWKIRLQQHKKLEDAAVAFSLRRNSPVVGKALQKWRKVCSAHKKRRALAASHHSKSLRRRIVLAWRIKLWNEHELMTKARDVDKYLVVRSAFTVLKTKFLDRKQKALESRLKALDLALKAWELRRTRAIFYVWFERAHRQRAQRLAEKQAEEYIRARIIKRIQANALSKWLNRTVDVKDRHQRAPDAWFIRVAFRRWKRKCMDAQKHHANVDSLMESHLLVEREGAYFFHPRRRRLTLEQKEAEFELDYLSDVWDKWRDRFKQQRLQPVEYDAILQRHQNTLTRTFRLWHSKTKVEIMIFVHAFVDFVQPLPAIRFDALRIKRMYWNLWREALPRALQTKTARDIEKKAVLSKFFDKWLQAHRTKMALKAVAYVVLSFAQDICVFLLLRFGQLPLPDRYLPALDLRHPTPDLRRSRYPEVYFLVELYERRNNRAKMTSQVRVGDKSQLQAQGAFVPIQVPRDVRIRGSPFPQHVRPALHAQRLACV
ncbi:CTLH domain-containing protein [Mycena venus]|uniref:CTLH domain-containing protein n=1 Tax=Mycena venus TaxID=2733690 RepID=A0A8H7CK59_9AGAR|nr:CTLH domain-containing protein [Mycena venus]